MTTNPKITIYGVIRGQKAVNKTIQLFKDPQNFPEDQYTSTEKRNALLIIYSYKSRTREQFGFRLIIGEDICGERYRKPLDNIQFLENYRPIVLNCSSKKYSKRFSSVYGISIRVIPNSLHFILLSSSLYF